MSHPLPQPVTAGIPAVVKPEEGRQHFGHLLERLSSHDPEDYDTLESAMNAMRHLVAWTEGLLAEAPAGSPIAATMQRAVRSARCIAEELKRAEDRWIARDERGDYVPLPVTRW